MSSNFLDAGDMQRLDRERMLTVQADRVPVENDRSPPEEPAEDNLMNMTVGDLMIQSIMSELERRLQ